MEYNIISAYFNWILITFENKGSLEDYIKLSDGDRVLDWKDVLEEKEQDIKENYLDENLEVKIKINKNKYYWRKYKLENIKKVKDRVYYTGNLVSEKDDKGNITSQGVIIEVDPINLLEFLYRTKTAEGHQHYPVYFR